MDFVVLLSVFVITLTRVIARPNDNITKDGDQGQGHNEDPYRVQLNGRQTWQSHSSSNMFVIPTPTLRVGNEIVMKGRMTEDQRLRVEVGSNSGLICYVNVVNRPNETDGEDLFEIIKDGEAIYRDKATPLLNRFNPSQYEIRFIMKSSQNDDQEHYMDIYFHDSSVSIVPLNVEDVKFISANGEVEEFNYIFKKISDNE